MVSPLVEGRKDGSHTKMAFACRGSDFNFSRNLVIHQTLRTIVRGVIQSIRICRMTRVRTRVVRAWMLLLKLVFWLVIKAMALATECPFLTAVVAKGVCLLGGT